MSILETLDILPAAEEEGMNPLHVLEGKFKGVKYKYGRVWFPEDSDNTLSYEYDLLEGSAPVAPEDMQEFSKFMGDVIMEILRRQLGIEGEAADAH